MRIQVLPEHVASQIAAGEVVERPASVVKELVENAIDAGATTVQVDVRRAGRELVQVADDGQGIPSNEIEMAFMRHATSKLASAADLETVATLGFRGEALASIAAVSQTTVVSRTAEEPAGTRLELEGSRVVSMETVGAPQGTVIAVASLFHNVPARLKFLKSNTTEKRLIDELVTRYALAYPEIRFRLTHDGRITFQSSGNGSVQDVLAAIYGPEKARQLLAIGGEDGQDDQKASDRQIIVTGYIGPPDLTWSNRNQITLFVNRRWIKDYRLAYAIIQAYHTLLPAGRYPLAVIFLDLPVEAVDVNVHPAKTEVRLRQSNTVFAAVQRAVRGKLIAETPIRQAAHFAASHAGTWSGRLGAGSVARRDGEAQAALELGWVAGAGARTEVESRDDDSGALGGERLPIMRVVGQIGASYIISEGPDGLYLIDQHAAHERILYEQFMAAWEEGGEAKSMAAQGLVGGVTVHLSPGQATLLEDNLELLGRMGMEVEPFGPGAFMVRSVPALLTKLDPSQALLDVVEDLDSGETPLQKELESRIILRVCKSAAVKAGQILTRQEMEAMVRQLEQCQNPHTCPHGRPTLIHLSVSQLAREFGRT